MSNPDTAMFDWDQLLDLIDQGMVVPVVSKDLLVLPGGGTLYPWLAARLAQRLGQDGGPLSPGAELNGVACRYLAANPNNSLQKVYGALFRVMKEAEPELQQLPGPLVQLAQIRPFQLFVSTTFDSFLAKAINQVRFGGAERSRVLSYAPDARDDRSQPVLDPGGLPTVYHLMGKLSVTPSYAITQWDTVEYFHALQSETRGPSLLFDELRSRSLLMLGGSFDGWLARFFLRVAKGASGYGSTTDYFADPQLTGDQNMVLFIRVFTRGAEIYSGPGDAVAFLAELHRRWMEAHPEGNAPSPPAAPAPAPAEAGAVFISYASEDRVAAQSIATALLAAGVDVFFDRRDFQAGDAFDPIIERRIGDCSYFMPVISRHSLAPGDRYVKQEWNRAFERARRRLESEIFLLPVVADATGYDNPNVPAQLAGKHWERLAGCAPSPEFIQRVRDLFRKYQRAVAAGVS